MEQICLWRLAAYVASMAQTDSVRRRFYPFLSVRPARQRAGGARGCRIAGARRQAMGFGDRSDELGFWQDHDQHPDDLGNMERHGHSAAVDAAANGWKLAHVGADRAS